MEKKTDKSNIVTAIYGENYGENKPEDIIKQSKKEHTQKRIVQARMTLVFSITVTLLSLYSILNISPNSAEYVICLFVIIVNVLLITGTCLFAAFSKYK